jgi:hypothetical protein
MNEATLKEAYMLMVDDDVGSTCLITNSSYSSYGSVAPCPDLIRIIGCGSYLPGDELAS